MSSASSLHLYAKKKAFRNERLEELKIISEYWFEITDLFDHYI